MTIESGLYRHLSADAGVSALVGTRIHKGIATQNQTRPYITLFPVSNPKLRSLTGPSGLANPRIQIDSWGDTYASAKSVAEAVRKALDGFRGLMGSVRVRGSILQTDRYLYDDGAKLHRFSADFTFWHDEEI